MAPIKVNALETAMSVALGFPGGTNANPAEIKNAMQPMRFAEVTLHEMLDGIHAQCAWHVSINAR